MAKIEKYVVAECKKRGGTLSEIVTQPISVVFL